ATVAMTPTGPPPRLATNAFHAAKSDACVLEQVTVPRSRSISVTFAPADDHPAKPMSHAPHTNSKPEVSLGRVYPGGRGTVTLMGMSSPDGSRTIGGSCDDKNNRVVIC